MEIAHYASESVLLYDLDGIVRYGNPAAAALFGWRTEDILGRSFTSLALDDRRDPELWQKLLTDGHWRGLQHRRSTAGSVVIANVRLDLRRDASGQPTDVVEFGGRPNEAPLEMPFPRGTEVRFTPSILDPQPARNSEPLPAVFQTGDDLNDLSTESVIIFALDGHIQYWSACAQWMYGWDKAQAAGTKIDTLLAPPLFQPHPRAYARVMSEGYWSGKLKRITASGDEIIVKVRWTLRIDADGVPDAVVEFGVAEHSETAFDRLKASEERYRKLFYRAPVALMLDDARGLTDIVLGLKAAGVTDMNAYIDAHPEFLDYAIDTVVVAEPNELAIKLFGATHASELTVPVRHIWRDTPDTFRRAVIALYEGASHFAEETKVRTLDGRTVDVLFSLAFAGQDEFMGASLNGMQDITARIEAEAQLRKVTADFTHAARLTTLGELTTSIAHEIKQPLSAILTNAQTSLRWLSREQPNIEKATQLAARIAESAQRASDIIGRIQDMAGKREPSRVPMNLNDVVKECLAFIRHENDDKAVTVQTALQPDLPEIFGDRIQLQQIVVNLFVNSVQAMKPPELKKRHILLATSVDRDDGVVFTIRDTGTGIPEAYLNHVFDGFFTTKENGMGIGLAICQSIVTAHGGRISATNHSDGGALFRFNIPVRGATAN